MEEKANQLSERLLDYGVEIIKLSIKLERTATGRHIANQLLRAGTSVGSNYEEARGAESRADFIHKLRIALKEIRESIYWLKLIRKSGILDRQNLDGVISETEQLVNIIAKSIITAKKGQ